MRTGFYKPLSGPVPGDVDKAALKGFSLVYIPITLDPTVDTVATSTLGALDTTLARCSELRVGAIPRCAYGWTSTPNDPPKGRILKHIDLVVPTLAKWRKTILTVQGGFIGSWGEQNNSANGNHTPVARAEINRRLWATLADVNVTTSFRTPAIVQQLGITDYSLVGLHNDCFCSSETNSGTYLRPPDTTLTIDQQKDFVAMLAVKGGETCKVSTYSTGDLALAEVKRLGMCYLNVDYNVDVLNAWKASGHYEKIQLALTENAPLSFCERAHDRMHLVLADVDAKLGQAGHLLALASDEIGAAV